MSGTSAKECSAIQLEEIRKLKSAGFSSPLKEIFLKKIGQMKLCCYQASIRIYGNLRCWTAKQFRAALQACFLPVSIISAILLGRYFNHRLKDGVFLRYVYIGLMVVVGFILLGQSVN